MRNAAMNDLKLLFDNLIRYEIELWNAIDSALRAECDIQLTWFEIMRFVAQRDGCRVQDMAKEFSITVGGTSKVVDRMEACGYCARRANPDDRRSSIIELTHTGQQVLDRASTVFDRELQRRIGAVLDGAAVQAATATISTLRAAGQVLDNQISAGERPS